MQDLFGRTIDYLRISVTDRCNARCMYCMPKEGIPSLDHTDILTYEQMAFFAKICAEQGVHTVRLTGGDPLVRKDLHTLIALLKQIPDIKKVYLTTNGLLLKEQLPQLVDAGLDGVNISLDSIDETLFSYLTRLPINQHGAATVLQAIHAALAIPHFQVKINCVPSGVNDSQLVPIAELAKDNNISVRFIELMPLGCAKHPDLTFRSRDYVASLIENELGKLHPIDNTRYEYCTIKGYKGTIGFISPVTHRFCSSCNRIRLTADGYIKACLQYPSTATIKPLVAQGLNEQTATQIRQLIAQQLAHKKEHNLFYASDVSEKQPVYTTTRYMNQIGG